MNAYESAEYCILSCNGSTAMATALISAIAHHSKLAKTNGESPEHQLTRGLQAVHAEHKDKETEEVEAALADLLERLSNSRPFCTRWCSARARISSR